jgi:hypothetical protein
LQNSLIPNTTLPHAENKHMSIAGLNEKKRLEMVASTMKEMEALGRRMRNLIAAQPPLDLLGYIYAQHILRDYRKPEETERPKPADDPGALTNERQFLLEYVHAVLASIPAQDDTTFDEAACAELFECASKLKSTTMFHAMVSSTGTENGSFGPYTADIEFHAKSTWILLRGNRHQVLESEFYAFVLAPHDAALRETYGIGADEIATGFQDMANTVRTGQSDAIEKIAEQFGAAQAFAEAQGKSFEEGSADWVKDHHAEMASTGLAFDDMLRGGVCNVSRHTALPPTLLADLAFERDEEKEFFKDGPYAGTPFRTLPARRRPLIKLGDDFYAVDPCFARDAGYRALLWNLLRRKPEYKKDFETRQKSMSEAAFFQIFDTQLKGATIHQEVYYKDPVTGQWVENDTLVLIDDALILVEAKAGAAATIASPTLDFSRHTRAVQDLVVKAYKQCKRFFDYLESADEVSIYKRTSDKYVECGRLRRSDYRIMLPIGLTVESFSPFSAMCKELPVIAHLLGKYPFFSLSIDDLFVLKRFLPTMGQLAHYLEVRQVVAGMRGAHLFDELDHLGAYIKKNRFDQDLAEQFSNDKPGMVVWDGMSAVVDRHFEGEDWEMRPVPTQYFPNEVLGLLGALDRARVPGWLSAESDIRNYGEEGRNELAHLLATCRTTLDEHPSRYFCFIGEPSLFVWLQRAGTGYNPLAVSDKASAAALATKSPSMIALLVGVEAAGSYVTAQRYDVDVPLERTAANSRIYEDAERMLSHQGAIKTAGTGQRSAPVQRPGRNDPCWCGSSLKFKKCHGR